MENPLKIVVVGGVAGGASAATRARRKCAHSEITIFEKGPAVSFANCGLPYHLGGEIHDRNKLIVATPDLFWNRFHIHVKTNHEVMKIDRDHKTIRVNDHLSNTMFDVPYDRLILATGAEPIRPAFADPMPENAFHLWTLSDMDRIMDYLERNSVQRATVIGGGFVGLEVVEQLHARGIAVSVVERLPQVLTRLDPPFARMVENHMRAKNVAVYVGESVESLQRFHHRVIGVSLSDGQDIETDLLIVGAGVKPRIQLAVDARLDIGSAGGVQVNEWMQTSDPLIYAVGDIAEYRNGVTNEHGLNPLAGPANRSGRIAGEHAVSNQAAAMGKVLGTSIVRVFDLTAASTGLNESQLIARNIDYRTSIIQAPNHASYYPGALSMQLKILYEAETGRILGAQAVGGAGVDKRIDILATAIHFGGTVFDLAELDLAYAPPFGSAKDPIHMAAFTAINDLDHFPDLLAPDAELNGMQVVDVRTAKERAALPLPNAVSIEIDEFPNRHSELDPWKPTVIVCHSGKRAHIAACRLRSLGFKKVYNLTGGMAIRSLVTERKREL